MNAVIDSILRENTEYYRRMKTLLVGRLLVNERGSLKRKIIDGKAYKYLRKKFFGNSFEKYIGPEYSQDSFRIEKALSQNKTDQEELDRAKDALKKLRVKNMNYEDFSERLRELFHLMEEQGLWDEGLQLIGSWCFKVYQNFFGVEHYPERTVDVDFAIHIPYRGVPVQIGRKLVDMGFQEDRNMSDGTIRYVAGDISVEFLKQQKSDGRNQGDPYIPELDIAPQALPYLNILLDRPVTRTFRGLGKITVPSMPAFMVHKLIVASKRRDPAKKEKDIRQARAVAQVLSGDLDHLAELTAVFAGLHKTRKRMVVKSAKEADQMVSGATAVFLKVLEDLEGSSTHAHNDKN
jgi:hypothetical protein